MKGKVKICEQQFGFMPRKTTTDALFALGMLMKNKEKDNKSCIASSWT